VKKGVWTQSSGCDTASCVEVMYVGDKFFVRDSKDPLAPVLTFNEAEWDAFVRGVHDGEFDI
jgi:hypothetical protein